MGNMMENDNKFKPLINFCKQIESEKAQMSKTGMKLKPIKIEEKLE